MVRGCYIYINYNKIYMHFTFNCFCPWKTICRVKSNEITRYVIYVCTEFCFVFSSNNESGNGDDWAQALVLLVSYYLIRECIPSDLL